MFRDMYKAANDDIIPDSKLLDKILAANKPKKNHYATFMRYGSVAAAFFILAGTLTIYPKIKDNLTNDEAVPKVVISEDVEYAPFEASTKPSNETSASFQDTNNFVFDTSEPEMTAKPIKKQTEKTATSPAEVSIPSPTPVDGNVSQYEINGFVAPKPTQQNISKEPAPAVSEVHISEEPKADIQEIHISEKTETVILKESVPEEQDAGVSTASIMPLPTDETVSINSEPQIAISGGGSGGGSSSAPKARTVSVVISESDATELADKAFSEDFGEEFLDKTKIKIEYNTEYIITRYNEEISKTIIISDDGKLQKQY